MSQFTSIRHDKPASSTQRELAAAQPSTTVPQTKPAENPPTWRHRVRASLPTALVLGLLFVVAIWGHSTDWTIPKFSAMFGGGGEEKNDWCEEHNVPESQCIECNQDLVPKLPDYGWCAEHGIAQCPLHHPDIAQLNDVPIVTDADLERAARALAILPRAENNSHCKMYQKRLQFASTEAVEKVGLDVATVEQRPIVDAISANGEIVYDQMHTAHLASRVSGTVWQVEKQIGQHVSKGDVLALIESAEIGHSKADFLQALTQLRLARANVDRLFPLADDGAVAGKSLQEAQAALQEAQIKTLSAQQALVNLGLPVTADQFARLSTEKIAQQIQFLGLPKPLTDSLDKDSATSNLFPLRSPLNGVVVDSKIVAGESVDTAANIYTVTDLSHMWLVLDVRQDDVRRLQNGQPVIFQPTDFKQPANIQGTIAWISTEADDKTRTVKVRVDLPNSNATLRANTFGTGQIVLREEPQAVVVPTEAIHSDGDCHIVFVRDKNYLIDGAPKYFHVREVRLGATSGDMTEIIAGVLPGEIVASKNSAVLEAQLLKGNLAADED